MFGIAVNSFRQSVRKQKARDRQYQLLSGLRREARTSDEEPETGWRDRTIQIAFNGLPKGQREALYLREILECSCAETAVILGISENSVKNRVYHGRIRLRQIVESLEQDGARRCVRGGH
jgi:RNA polymerase sigma factor (sigma-70 family)